MSADDVDPVLREIFEAEVSEAVDVIQADVLRLEQGDAEADGLLEEMLRLAHDVKGSARVLGFRDAGELSHAMEDRLVRWRGAGRVAPDEADVVLRAADTLRALSRAPGDAVLLDVTHQLIPELRAAPESDDGPADPTADAPDASTVDADAAHADAGAGAAPADPHAAALGSPSDTRADAAASRRADATRSTPATPPAGSTPPAAEPKLPDRTRGATDAAATVKVSGEALDLVRTGVSALLADSFVADSHVSRLSDALGVIVSEELPHGASAGFARARTQLRDAVQALQSVVRTLNTHAKSLAEQARTLGIAPVTGLLVHLERTVRDTARTVGRDVAFEVEGRDLLLDAQFLEPLKAPLAHLLRNAVDHGLEPPEERAAAGKPTQGTIHVRLSSDGEHFEIVVTDDGRGLDLAKLRDRLGDEADGLSDQEIMNTIFRPGVTTRDEATRISGRGVGLDSVATMVRDVGGRVFVTSQAGSGSTFRLVLPMCLSVVEGIVIEAGGVRFVVPTSGLDEVVPADGAELSLAEVLGMPRTGEVGMGLRLHGHEGVFEVGVEFAGLSALDVVTLPLPRHVGHVPHVSGATILNRGDPALILDARGLADHLLGAGAPELSRAPVSDDVAPPLVLVADDSSTMRTRLASALTDAGFRVHEAEDVAVALEVLATHDFDAVVSDIQMPHGSGFDVLAAAPEGVPVVLCTAYPDEVGRQRAREGGALHYLAKDTGIGARVVEALRTALPASPLTDGANR